MMNSVLNESLYIPKKIPFLIKDLIEGLLNKNP